MERQFGLFKQEGAVLLCERPQKSYQPKGSVRKDFLSLVRKVRPPMAEACFQMWAAFGVVLQAQLGELGHGYGQCFSDAPEPSFPTPGIGLVDRKSTRLNSSHLGISYAVFCLK